MCDDGHNICKSLKCFPHNISSGRQWSVYSHYKRLFLPSRHINYVIVISSMFQVIWNQSHVTPVPKCQACLEERSSSEAAMSASVQSKKWVETASTWCAELFFQPSINSILHKPTEAGSSRLVMTSPQMSEPVVSSGVDYSSVSGLLNSVFLGGGWLSENRRGLRKKKINNTWFIDH